MATAANGGVGPEEDAVGRKLATFGEPAKLELLRRAAGDDDHWRTFAQDLLCDWPTWSPSDVPALRAALRREPGGWMARPLRTIGTAEAIGALAEDLPKSDAGNQTDFALEKLGPAAVPFLMPLFEDDKAAEAAGRVIAAARDADAFFQQRWVRVANDPAEPLMKRVAALRALAALGSKARPSASSIGALAHSPVQKVGQQAKLTIAALTSFEAKGAPDGEEVSLIALIGNPEKYDGKQVVVMGFLRLEFEGNAIYVHREDYEEGISKNAIWVDVPIDLSGKQIGEVDRKYVMCAGTFHAAKHGHMGMFSGELSDITLLSAWEPAVRER